MISGESIQKKMDSMDGGEGLTNSEESIFLEAIEFAENYYQFGIEQILQQMKQLKEKLNQYRIKLEEIKGGVYHG